VKLNQAVVAEQKPAVVCCGWWTSAACSSSEYAWELPRVLTRPAVKPAKAKLLSCYERADSAPLRNKPT